MRHLLTFVFALLIAGSAWAQPKGPPGTFKKEFPKGYVHFGFDPNVESLVKDRLKIEHDLGPFKDLVKHILENPDKFTFDPEQLKNAKMDDPAMKKAVQNWIAQDPSLKKAVENWIQNQPTQAKSGDVQKFQTNLKELIERAPPPSKVEPSPFVQKWPRPPVPPRQDEDVVKKAIARSMNEAENSNVGDWLKNSPGWQRAMDDLRSSFQGADGTKWDLGQWQKRLGINEQKAWELGKDTFSRLQNLPRPNFENTNWNRALPAPTFDMPGMPNYSGPSLPSFSNGATWALLLLLTGLFGWQMLRWTKRINVTSDERARLGPWPIEPSGVSTRRELVQAFDYLALLTLGLRVNSWNHHAVARRWSEQAPSLAPVAHSLAALYEASRYTAGIEELPQSQREQARLALTQLAEALQ